MLFLHHTLSFQIILFFCNICTNHLVHGHIRDDISLDLAFVHMRKAGGTMIRELLGEWLKLQGCSFQSSNSIGRFGIDRGHYIFDNGTISDDGFCPGVTIAVNEYGFVNAKNVLKVGAPIGNRKSNLKVLTTIRNPIRRIISQAYYNGFGTHTIREISNKRCGTSNDMIAFNMIVDKCNSEKISYKSSISTSTSTSTSSSTSRTTIALSPNCSCVIAAQLAGRQEVRNNKAGWLKYLDQVSTGLGDQYMDNYYVKRLAGFRRRYSYRKVNAEQSVTSKSLLHDLWGATMKPGRDEDISDPEFSRAVGTTNFVSLFDVYNVNSRTFPSQASDEMLEDAKLLLSNHFDVLIMELFNEEVSLKILNEVLGGKPLQRRTKSLGSVNAGVLTKTGYSIPTGIADTDAYALK